MAYVELHTLESAYRIVLVDVDTGDAPNEATVTNVAFIDPMIWDLGVREHGPWEPIVGDGTHDVQRALIVAFK